MAATPFVQNEIRGHATGTLIAKVTLAVSEEQYVDAQF